MSEVIKTVSDCVIIFFFFNDTATTEIYTLSLHDALPIRAIAEVIGRHLDVPVVSVPAGQASEHFGFLAGFLTADNPASSTLTRELLGWQPAHPGLIEDLDKGHYFHSRPAQSAEPEGHRGGTS